MGIKAKIEKRPEGGFSISFEENGSGDLNKVIDDLCEKHRDDSLRYFLRESLSLQGRDDSRLPVMNWQLDYTFF